MHDVIFFFHLTINCDLNGMIMKKRKYENVMTRIEEIKLAKCRQRHPFGVVNFQMETLWQQTQWSVYQTNVDLLLVILVRAFRFPFYFSLSLHQIEWSCHLWPDSHIVTPIHPTTELCTTSIINAQRLQVFQRHTNCTFIAAFITNGLFQERQRERGAEKRERER